MIDEAVFDTGPLLHLGEIDSKEPLEIFGKIYTTSTVEEELEEPGVEISSIVKRKLEAESKDRAKHLADRKGLELGEATSIALCLQEGIEYFFTDDLEARKTAETRGLEAHGTLAIVTRAYSLEIIEMEEAEQAIKDLYMDSSLFVTRDLVDWALEKIRKT